MQCRVIQNHPWVLAFLPSRLPVLLAATLVQLSGSCLERLLSRAIFAGVGALRRAAASATAQKMYCPAYKWGQTDSYVIVTLDVSEEHINKHDITPEGTVSVQGLVPNKGEFSLDLDLCGPILVQRCQVLFKSRSTQIKLAKKEQVLRKKEFIRQLGMCLYHE